MGVYFPASGKTGTTDGNRDSWFVGYTPDLAAAVWVGDPRGGQQYPMKNLRINGRYYSQVFGSLMPGPVWREAMRGALEGMPGTKWQLTTLFGLLAVELGVYLTAEQGPALTHTLAAAFFVVSMVFVYRSFYGMRIED